MQTHRKEYRYFPSQPEMQKNTIDYKEFKPKSNHIALFYQFKTAKEQNSSISLIPDGCLDIVFCCSTSSADAFLWTSPFSRCEKPVFQKGCEYFGIRLFPEQSIVKLGKSMKELLNQQIPLRDVLSTEAIIIEKISTTPSFHQRIELFCKFIFQSHFQVSCDQEMIQYAIQQMNLSKGSISISSLSNSLHYSEQYFRKKFEKYIGFSPKQFCQIIKFQNALNRFLVSDDTLLNVCLDNGYYDQSHFVKEFKKFIQLTPKQYKNFFH